jgi:hypothetical protein
MMVVFGLLAPQIAEAQGTITYLSNLGQSSAGSLAVGSDSWLAALFFTGNNTGGYDLNSVQLGMMDATGNPNDFTVMLYSAISGAAILPGSNLGSLSGSAAPTTAGTYTYTAPANLALSPNSAYFIVLTAGTTVANGACKWSIAGTDSYNPIGGWAVIQGVSSGVYSSSSGSSWNSLSGDYPQFAVNASAVPEPGVAGLLGLGGLLFGLCRWKKVV